MDFADYIMQESAERDYCLAPKDARRCNAANRQLVMGFVRTIMKNGGVAAILLAGRIGARVRHIRCTQLGEACV